MNIQIHTCTIVNRQHSPRYYRSHSNVKKQKSVGITLNKSSCWLYFIIYDVSSTVQEKQEKQSTLNTYSKLHKGKVKVKFNVKCVSKSCWEPSNNTKGITILSLLHARIHSNNFYIINVSAMLHLQMALYNNRGNLWGLNDFPSPLLSCNFPLGFSNLDLSLVTCHI